MTVQTHRFSPLSMRRRFVLALAALVHVLAIVIAPIVEATAERVSVVHVEEEGSSQHHAHTETTCVVCAAQPLMANGGPQAYRFDVSALRQTVPAAFALEPLQSATGSPVGSRAPPISA